MNSFKKYIAEFIGTFVLVLFACGVAAVLGCTAEPNAAYVATALAFGLVIVAMAYSIGNVSGCHINPAVSLGMLITGRMSLGDFCGYVIAQFLGAIAGAATLWGITGNKEALGQNGLFNDNVLISMIVEIILTCVFVFTILYVTTKEEHKSVTGLVIGFTLTLVHLFGIYFTGTSVNPARSFGPALFAGDKALSCVWVFIVAPLIGAALAAVLYMLLSGKTKKAK